MIGFSLGARIVFSVGDRIVFSLGARIVFSYQRASHFLCRRNHIDSVLVSVLVSSVLDRGFEPLVISNKRIYNWHFVFLRYARNIKWKQRLVDSDQNNVSE
jgi:hypothetical protein